MSLLEDLKQACKDNEFCSLAKRGRSTLKHMATDAKASIKRNVADYCANESCGGFVTGAEVESWRQAVLELQARTEKLEQAIAGLKTEK